VVVVVDLQSCLGDVLTFWAAGLARCWAFGSTTPCDSLPLLAESRHPLQSGHLGGDVELAVGSSLD
jgi:hypothetical protein